MNLVEIGREDNHPTSIINNAMEGIDIDYSFSGKRIGNKGKIELHVTSILVDSNKKPYIRKCRYLGNKKDWKTCIRKHIIQHLMDLHVGFMLVQSLMSDFEVENKKVVPLVE
jgi:hypothetical protein